MPIVRAPMMHAPMAVCVLTRATPNLWHPVRLLVRAVPVTRETTARLSLIHVLVDHASTVALAQVRCLRCTSTRAHVLLDTLA